MARVKLTLQTKSVCGAGIAKTLFMEERSRFSPSIDLDSCGPLPTSSVLACVLRQPGEFAVAIRSQRTYSLRLMPAYATRPRAAPTVTTAFVAGGTKGLGLEYCKALVRQGCRTLVVTSRAGDMDAGCRQLFEAQGVRLVVLKADAGASDDMERVLTWVREELPYIQHYAHAAGVSGFDMLQDMTPSAFWQVANAKVTGAAAAATHLPAPQSQLLFSSTSAIWSQTGASHYAAANAFLDGFATQTQYTGLPATSLQLGPFAGAGMAADHVDQLEAIGLRALQPQDIRTAAGVAGVQPQLANARIQASRFARLYTAKGRWSLVDRMLTMSAYAPSRTNAAPDASHQNTVALHGLKEVHPAEVVALEAVVVVIRTAAADIIGEALQGTVTQKTHDNKLETYTDSVMCPLQVHHPATPSLLAPLTLWALWRCRTMWGRRWACSCLALWSLTTPQYRAWRRMCTSNSTLTAAPQRWPSSLCSRWLWIPRRPSRLC
jgi:NAD(P)-dependent dehydrogenase (short-subunit alcohol dehydrogenase family)